MSTIFAIFKIPVQTNELGEIISEYMADDYVEIAVRGSSGIYWSSAFQVAEFALKDSVPVYPLDNTAQGIFTIGDIKKEIKLQLKGQKKREPKPKRILNPGFLVWWSFWPKNDGFAGFEVTRHFPLTSAVMNKCERKYLELIKEYKDAGVANEEHFWDALQYEIEWRKEKSIKTGKNELTFMSGPEPYLNQRKFEPFLGEKWKNNKTENRKYNGAVDI